MTSHILRDSQSFGFSHTEVREWLFHHTMEQIDGYLELSLILGSSTLFLLVFLPSHPKVGNFWVLSMDDITFSKVSPASALRLPELSVTELLHKEWRTTSKRWRRRMLGRELEGRPPHLRSLPKKNFSPILGNPEIWHVKPTPSLFRREQALF